MIYQLIRWIGLPGFVIAGLLAFYEGVPFLKFWPVTSIPYAGPAIEGEITRRINRAVEANEADWLRKVADAKRKQREIRIAKNAEIRDAEAARLTAEAEQNRLTQKAADALARAIEAEGQEPRTVAIPLPGPTLQCPQTQGEANVTLTCPPQRACPVCRPLRSRIPDSVLRNFQ